MITVKAQIKVSGNGGEVQNITSDVSGNNVSRSLNQLIGNNNVTLGNPFILGRSILGQGDTYVKELPYFMGTVLSNSNGIFPNSYQITIEGENLKEAIIVFDKENNAHPNTVIVDDKTIYDDDAEFELAFDTSTNTHTITIFDWNKPNSPLIITSIYTDITVNIDRNNLLSFDSDIMELDNIQYPSFGIISNSAQLNYSDRKQESLDLITQQIIHSGIRVSVSLNNDEVGASEPICEMKIQSLSYDSDNHQVNLSLKDNIEEWQEINVAPIYYDISNPKSEKAKWLYDYLYGITTDLGYTFEELSDDTLSVLTNTTIEYPLLETGSLWDEWTKLCELCFLNIYVNNQGNVVVKYNGIKENS